MSVTTRRQFVESTLVSGLRQTPTRSFQRALIGLSVSLLITAVSPRSAFAELAPPPAVTYQGRLELDGAAIDESCDMIFGLYDAPVGGMLLQQIGAPAAPISLEVMQGLFTTELMFDETMFDGGERWLEIAVRRTADGGPFTVLLPRQKFSSSPYALYARRGGDVTSLQEAYNKDGPGGGRTIHVDAGSMRLEGPDGLYVEGNVGIGVVNPSQPLQVNGFIQSTLGGYIFPDGTVQESAAILDPANPPDFPRWLNNTTRLFSFPLSTNVGIGTAFPDERLHIDGNLKVVGTVAAGAFSSMSPLELQTGGTTRIFVDDPSGFVAVGTTAPQRIPQSLLHLADDVADAIVTLEVNPNDDIMPPGVTGILFQTGTGGGAVLGEIIVDEADAGSPLSLNGTSANNVLLAVGGGNVGVGEDMPMAKLHVGGTAGVDGIMFPDGTLQTTAAMSIDDHGMLMGLLDDDHPQYALLAGRAGGQALSGGNAANENLTLDSTANAMKGFVLINPMGGNVGIGTDMPMALLHLAGTPGVDGIMFPDGTLQTTAATNDHGMLMGLLDDDHPQYALLAGRAGGQALSGGHASGEDLTLDSTSDGMKGDVLINPTDGNVGVGTPTPMEKLDVVGGNVRTDMQLISTVPDGTSPLVVASMTRVDNLNADKLDGRHEDEFALLAGRPGGQTLHGGTENEEDLFLESTSGETQGFVVVNSKPVEPGEGSVGIGTANPTEALEVIGCIKADCLLITADNIIEISPLGAVAFGNGLTMMPNPSGTTVARPLMTGTQNVMIPVTIPRTLFGVDQMVSNLRICYRLTSPNSFITATRLRAMQDNGEFVNLIDDPADRKSSAWSCYDITPSSPVTVTGPLFIHLELSISGTSPPHDIEIGRISLTIPGA